MIPGKKLALFNWFSIITYLGCCSFITYEIVIFYVWNSYVFKYNSAL